jgi:hypothetical protein
MSQVSKFWPYPQLPLLFFFLLAVSFSVVAQDRVAKDKDKRGEKESDKAANNFVKLAGKVRCDKPDPAHSIEVPDRPGHQLIIAKRKCTWTEPMAIMGTKTKDGVIVDFAEQKEGALSTNGFEVDTLNDGEKLTMHKDGQVFGEKGPATTKGRWHFMRGTGRLRGIKGGGSYEGKLEEDDVLTVEFEGVYDPSAVVGEKK